MREVILSPEDSAILSGVLDGDVSDPVELLRSLGVDVAVFFEFGIWDGVDFTNSNLEGVSFRGAKVEGALLSDEQREIVQRTMDTDRPESESRLSVQKPSPVRKKPSTSFRKRRPSSQKSSVEATVHGFPQKKASLQSHHASGPLPQRSHLQQTLRRVATFTGVGLHSGRVIKVQILPQAANVGIWFRRTDLRDAEMIPARYDLVPESRLCTKLVAEDGAEVATVEHLMAALVGCGVHNALIELNDVEIPILDGSAAPFVRGILDAGIQRQRAPVHFLEVLKTVEVKDGDRFAKLEPGHSLIIDFTIDFDDEAIGFQSRREDFSGPAFVRDICDSRTFCRQSDVEMMHEAGLALGGTYDNTVVVDGAEVLTPGGLRHPDEAVRHKILDALGDLALAGAPIVGRYTAHRGDHMLTNQLLRKLFATAGAVRLEQATEETYAFRPDISDGYLNTAS